MTHFHRRFAATRCPGPAPAGPVPMHWLAKLATAALLVVAGNLTPAVAQLPVIELTSITPQAGRAGATLELRLSGGAQLEGVERLIFSDPRITAKPAGGEPQAARFEVAIPADLAPGRYELQAAGTYGVSNPRVFRVTRSPVLTLEAVSHQRSAATPLDPHLASGSLVLSQRATAGQVDYYRLSDNPKSPRHVRLDAQSLDSRMIAQVTLIGPDGQVLQRVRGADGIDPEAVIIPAGQVGQYTLAIHDFMYRGGDAYFYNVRIDTGEAAEVTAPLCSIGSETVLGDHTSLVAITAAESIGDDFDLPTLNAVPGGEEAPLSLVPPCVVDAVFAPARGAHVFHFEAEQGQRLAIEVISQRLDQPTDPWLVVERLEPQPEGPPRAHGVVNQDDPPVVGDAALRLRSKDPVVDFTAPASGTYRITLRNLDTGRVLTEQPRYRLVLRESAPGFNLVAMWAYPHSDPGQGRPRGCQLLRGDTQAIRVVAVRRDGFTGPIDISLADLPPGLQCPRVTIAANQTEAFLSLSTAEDAPAWTGPLQVVGTASHGDTQLTRRAAAATLLWGAGEGRDFITSRRATKLWGSVSDQQLAPLSVRLGDSQAAAAPRGGGVSLPISLARRDGAGGPVTLRPRNLPPGVTAAEVVVAAEQSSGTLELKVAADAKPGRYSIWLQAETKVQFKPLTQAEPRELTVFPPSTTATIDLTESP